MENVENVVQLRHKQSNGVFDMISAECDQCLEEYNTQRPFTSANYDSPRIEENTYFVYEKAEMNSASPPQSIPPPMHLLNLDRLMNGSEASTHESVSSHDKQFPQSPSSQKLLSYMGPILSSFERTLGLRDDPTDDLNKEAIIHNYIESTRDSGLSSHSSNSGQDFATLSMRKKPNRSNNETLPEAIDVTKYMRNSKSTECVDREPSQELISDYRELLNFGATDLYKAHGHEKPLSMSPIWKRDPMRVDSIDSPSYNAENDEKSSACVACTTLKKFFVFRPTRMLHLERLQNALFLIEQEATKCASCWRKINQISVNLFNKNFKHGISYYLRNLMSDTTLPNSPESMNRRVKVNRSVANFIEDNICQLNTSNVGNFLGQQQFIVKILSATNETLIHVKICPQKITKFLLSSLNFKGCEIDEALRLFINKYALAGESQEIDRVLQIFAEVYHSTRWSPEAPLMLNNAPLDVYHVYAISYAIIIIQTSLHKTGPNASKKREVHSKSIMNDFIGSVTIMLSERRETDSDLSIKQRVNLYSVKKLKTIFSRVHTNPFIFEDRQIAILQNLKDAFTKTEILKKTNNTNPKDIQMKFNWLVTPQRRLVCYCAMYQFQDPLKNLSRDKFKLRHVFLFNDLILVAAELSLQTAVNKTAKRVFKPPVELLFQGNEHGNINTQPAVGCMGITTKDVMTKKPQERLFIEVCSFSILGCSVRTEKKSHVPFAISIWQQSTLTNLPNESYWHCIIQLASVTSNDHLRFLRDLNSVLFEANLSRTALDVMK